MRQHRCADPAGKHTGRQDHEKIELREVTSDGPQLNELDDALPVAKD
jgi:hypothetical protein